MINYTTTYFHCFYSYLNLFKNKRTLSLNRIVVFIILIFFTIVSDSEKLSGQGIYIAPNTNVFVHFDTVALFSNVYNSGNLATKPGTVISFMGASWQNDSTATLPDEASYKAGSSTPTSFNGTGGVFWFNNPNGISGTPQLLNGGYIISSAVGPTFPNLQIDNLKDVFLSGGKDTRVRNVLNFNNGKIWMNGNNFFVGNNFNPGTINGYSEKSYFVTGEVDNSGYLYRAKVGNTPRTVFPIGASYLYYTPVAVSYNGTAQNFRVKAFNQILSNAVSGIAGDQSFVQTTWNIGKEDNEAAQADLFIQHQKELEGSIFTSKRDSSYISRYDFAKQAWDTVPPSGVLTPGTITAGFKQDSSFENIRSFITPLTTNEYFSKSVALSTPISSALGITKYADQVSAQIDGTYNVDYRIVVENKGSSALGNVGVSDNLSKTFPSPITFTTRSLTATGGLVVNPKYNGVGIGPDTTLLLPSAYLNYRNTDTIHLSINVDPHKISGTFYNVVFGNARSAITGKDVPEVVSSVPIILNPLRIHIPEGFSPNGDGVNDKFVIANTSGYKITMDVYNRWGVKVYSSNGYYNNDWDGTSNVPGVFLNTRIADGTYFYDITVIDIQTNETNRTEGAITLRR